MNCRRVWARSFVVGSDRLDLRVCCLRRVVFCRRKKVDGLGGGIGDSVVTVVVVVDDEEMMSDLSLG